MARAIEIEGVPGPGRIGRVAIGDVLHRTARRFPDKVALADAGKHTTYRELDQMANRCANYFLSRGLQKGDKVSTICSNSTAFAAVLYGIHKAGLVWVPINTTLAREDMSYILSHGADLAIADHQARQRVLTATMPRPARCRCSTGGNRRRQDRLDAGPGQSLHRRPR